MSMVGNKSGRRKILWGAFLRVCLAVVPLSVGATSLAYWLFAGQWDAKAAWMGLAAGGGIMLIILTVNFFTPVQRLPYVR